MKKIIVLLFIFTYASAQDSTFSHYKKVGVIDSVIFAGDTKIFDIDENFHISLTSFYNYDISHTWILRDNERICSRCLRWEKYHEEYVPVYTYDPFYVAKQKALSLMKEKR